MKTLADIQVGTTVTVQKLHGDRTVRRRMMDMGITKNCPINVCKTAPLGDPIELDLRGYRLTVRKEDAALVEVK